MQTEHLAMAYVPVQAWTGNCFEWEQALRVGTIFPELNLPFFAAEQFCCGKTDETGMTDREALMNQISCVSFALDDLRLFLDTHPEQQEAHNLREQLVMKRKELLKNYAENYYPLTRDCAGPWTKGPAPWEGACC